MKFNETKIMFFLAIPDIISLLNLSFGFLAILMAFNNNTSLASILIIISIVFDSIDGWVARKVGRNDEYDFGKNIDSLADVVSFGVGPGILLYAIGNSYFHEIGFFSILVAIISLFIVICGVLRLTRFNVIAGNIEYDGFIGLPIPATALLLATFVLSGFFNIYIAIVLMIATSLLMVSNLKYPKFKSLKFASVAGILILLMIVVYSVGYSGINLPAAILFLSNLVFILINIVRKN